MRWSFCLAPTSGAGPLDCRCTNEVQRVVLVIAAFGHILASLLLLSSRLWSRRSPTAFKGRISALLTGYGASYFAVSLCALIFSEAYDEAPRPIGVDVGIAAASIVPCGLLMVTLYCLSRHFRYSCYRLHIALHALVCTLLLIVLFATLVATLVGVRFNPFDATTQESDDTFSPSAVRTVFNVLGGLKCALFMLLFAIVATKPSRIDIKINCSSSFGESVESNDATLGDDRLLRGATLVGLAAFTAESALVAIAPESSTAVLITALVGLAACASLGCPFCLPSTKPKMGTPAETRFTMIFAPTPSKDEPNAQPKPADDVRSVQVASESRCPSAAGSRLGPLPPPAVRGRSRCTALCLGAVPSADYVQSAQPPLPSALSIGNMSQYTFQGGLTPVHKTFGADLHRPLTRPSTGQTAMSMLSRRTSHSALTAVDSRTSLLDAEAEQNKVQRHPSPLLPSQRHGSRHQHERVMDNAAEEVLAEAQPHSRRSLTLPPLTAPVWLRRPPKTAPAQSLTLRSDLGSWRTAPRPPPDSPLTPLTPLSVVVHRSLHPQIQHPRPPLNNKDEACHDSGVVRDLDLLLLSPRRMGDSESHDHANSHVATPRTSSQISVRRGSAESLVDP